MVKFVPNPLIVLTQKQVMHKPLALDDIEEASDCSSFLPSQKPSPKKVIQPIIEPCKIIKNEKVELPTMLQNIVVHTKQHQINERLREIKFDELESNMDSQQLSFEQYPIDILEDSIEPILNPQPIIDDNGYFDYQLYQDQLEVEQIREPIQQQFKQQPKSQPIKQAQSTAKVYNPKQSLIYLRLQGTPELYKPQVIQPEPEQARQPDDLIDDLQYMQRFIIGLTINNHKRTDLKVSQPQPQQQPIRQAKTKLLEQLKQEKEENKRQQLQRKQDKIDAMKYKQILKQQRYEQQQAKIQHRKNQQQKFVLQINAKKQLTMGLVLYRGIVRERERERIQWLRYTELAQIYKGCEEIFVFERRIADQNYNQLIKKQSYKQFRIIDGQVIGCVQIYVNTNTTQIMDKEYTKKSNQKQVEAQHSSNKQGHQNKNNNINADDTLLDADKLLIYNYKKGRHNTQHTQDSKHKDKNQRIKIEEVDKEPVRKALHNKTKSKYMSRLEIDESMSRRTTRTKAHKKIHNKYDENCEVEGTKLKKQKI